MASFISELINRRVTVRLATMAAFVTMQLLLTAACLLALKQNVVLRERASAYLGWAAPLVGRDVPPITGVDWKGARQVVDHKQDPRPTLIYTFTKDCPSCKANWTAMRSVQSMSPTRLRIVYVDTADKLTDDYLREHGIGQNIVFSTLDAYSALNYQIRGTPQAELVDNQGRVVWSKLGEFRSADIATLVTAIERVEGQSLVTNTNKGEER